MSPVRKRDRARRRVLLAMRHTDVRAEAGRGARVCARAVPSVALVLRKRLFGGGNFYRGRRGAALRQKSIAADSPASWLRGDRGGGPDNYSHDDSSQYPDIDSPIG